MHLTGSELLDWIGLRRVHEGGVEMHGVEHVDWGRKVPCYLPEVTGEWFHDRPARTGALV